MGEIKYKVIKHIGVVGSNCGWTKELNIISWNDKERKFDLRNWTENHTKMSKGITMTKNELLNLKELLDSIDIKAVFGAETPDDIIDEHLLDEM